MKVLPIVGGGAPSELGVSLAVGAVVVGGAVVVVGVLAGGCGVVVVGGAGVAVVGRRPGGLGRGLPRGPQASLEGDDRLRAGIGLKRSSARITHYSREELEGSLVVGVVNFPPRQIGPVRSEVLVLGALDPELDVVLLRPDRNATVGSRIA